MRLLLWSAGFVFLCNLEAKELFTQEHILRYFNLENPSVYTALGEKYVYKERENYQLGNFDTNLALKYEKKEYPVSDGEFFSTALEKPIENGMEFSLAYRKAEGTQEYNNIKTGDDGEVLLGVKIPVFSVAQNMSKRKLDLGSAKLDTGRMNNQAKDNIRLLYFDTVAAYYKLLYFKENLQLVKGLLDNAKQRESIIAKRVKAGSLAKISSLEAKQQIINRQQQLLSTQNSYANALENFTRYLNLSSDQFSQEYTLPSILDIKEAYIETVASLEQALENRPDLKVFYYDKKKLELQEEFTSISKYPDLSVGLYGVHDFEYENGFKVTLGMDFPIERRKYLGKSLEIKKSKQNIDKKKEKKIIKIKTELNTINNSIKTLTDNIENAELEVDLVEQLEAAESKKYDIGLSNLFILNQREMYTLTVKKKFLKYNLEYLILQEELNTIVAKPVDGLL
jgi:outer membrane protein TolC